MTTTMELALAEPVESTWRHLPALDGLRACAVIGVLLFHAGYMQGGFLGVDLFFVLSGFLITSLLVRDAQGTGIAPVSFWGRRFRRLLPAAFVMIAVVAVWSFALGTAADLDGVKRDGPWAVVYLANWHLIGEAQGYWASFAQPAMFDHLWSLAIEEQFYVLWPLAVLAIFRFSKRPQRSLLVVTGVGALLSVAVMVALYDGGDPTRVYMGTDTRAASLLLGAFAAAQPAREWMLRFVSAVGDRINALIAGLGLLLLWTWLSIDGASDEALYRGGLLLHAVVCAALIAMIAASAGGRGAGVLSWGPLVRIGTLSYGLYLWHWPIYVIVSSSRTGIDGPGLLALRLGLSLLAAVVSFRLVEDPLRHRVSWVRGAAGLAVLVASVVGLLGLLRLLPEPQTEIAAFDPALVTDVRTVDVPLLVEAPTTPTTRPPRQPEETSTEATTRVPRTTPVTSLAPDVGAPAVASPTTEVPAIEEIRSVLWAGDSVAYDLGPGVVAALTSAGLEADIGGAYPGLRISGPVDYRQLRNDLPPKLAGNGADVVIAPVSTWDIDVSSDDYRAAVVELADVLESSGARLVLVSAPPVAEDDVNVGLRRLEAVVQEVADADPRVWFVDAASVWTVPVVPDRNGDGAPERKPDLTHVCPAGAAEFAAFLVGELDRMFVGLTVADPAEWAGGSWVTHPRFDEPVGACAPV